MTPGNIILLNGASSAGKSSILQALQTILEMPYLNVGIDHFIDQAPNATCFLWDEVVGSTVPSPHSHQLISGMHQTMAALARSGHHVVAEHLLLEPAWVRECAQLFYDLPLLFVGVHCPLTVLEEREQARRNRTSGQARTQMAVVHTPGVYDLEVHTAHHSPVECAQQIKQRLQAGPPPTAMRWLKAWSDPAKHRGWIRRSTG